jgi:hypothetical protein
MNRNESLALRAPWAHRAHPPASRGLRAGLRRWLLRTRDRESVRDLDARQRRDVGLESDAWGWESAELFWRV